MKKALRVLGIGLVVALARVQLVRPTRNEGVAERPDSLIRGHPVPDDVRDVLLRACYGCHSDATRYPWYALVQPLAWLIGRHVA